ncbi:SDR family NAD(P)-dependent oxidoreductase, partial [Nocardia cyriacigeorgica]|uniref:SDR family NAD(P)-dependent oxidoreductase n=1 Tax=Nocardia cyriacigeorgica TaxID=135487 RepID=UPI002454BA37
MQLANRSTGSLASARASTSSRAGGSAYGYQCDVTDSESVDQAVKAILDEHGHVDMLVNNAGRSI